MQLGIVGWPKVGKTLLFNILTGTHQETGKFTASQKWFTDSTGETRASVGTTLASRAPARRIASSR